MTFNFYISNYMIRSLLPLILSFSLLIPYQSIDSEKRVSFFNIGLDATSQFNLDKLHRSVVLVPFFIEKNNVGFGIYANPFIKEQYNDAGFQEFEPLIDSYLINFRFRYLRPIWKDAKLSVDLVHGDGNIYNWKNIVINWFELGFNYRFNYSSQLFLGYKYIINSNSNQIGFNGLYLNLIFGHSFLRR